MKPKINVTMNRTLLHGLRLIEKPRMLCGIPFDSSMVDAAWKKVKDKVTAKRGKRRDAGDTTHKLLKGNRTNSLTIIFRGIRESPKVRQNWAEGVCTFPDSPKMK